MCCVFFTLTHRGDLSVTLQLAVAMGQPVAETNVMSGGDKRDEWLRELERREKKKVKKKKVGGFGGEGESTQYRQDHSVTKSTNAEVSSPGSERNTSEARGWGWGWGCLSTSPSRSEGAPT